VIDPKDVIRHTSVERLNQSADNYFSSVTDLTHLLSKPFSDIREVPDLLMNIGLLIKGLRLGKSMTVLEMAAGSCWLSRYLCELRCHVIACDVSPAALEIGKQLFQKLPLVRQPIAEPRFLLFDGHQLELESDSIDRVIFNDGFHHVPNIHQVLSEIYRVLKPGGIAGFAEPGRHHSRSAQSQIEMSSYSVLENDINLQEINDVAKSVGFGDLNTAILSDGYVQPDQHRQILNNAMSIETSGQILKSCTQTMSNKTIFFLSKGEFVPDSRSAEGLACAIELLRREEFEYKLKLSMKILNTGSSKWLCRNFADIGIVKVGVQLLSLDQLLINDSYKRFDLGQDVSPGQQLFIELEIPLPADHGSRLLRIDLVSEDVCWFGHLGSTPLLVTL